ncbi:hypothetical protein [Bacillus sinesaloumensis]|uniref:hypothetical protein n=1 Tax=Litchfieldia sinesaloumensis TaxID=1926280 RepID=UPI0009885F44|nr:hypothetical protein [Bacillus sinesaloumensis]
MMSRIARYGVTFAIVLFAVFYSSKFFTPTEQYTNTDEELKGELIVNGFKMEGITFYGNQVLALLEEEGERKLYIGDHQQATIDNLKPWADFQVPKSSVKRYQGVEVNPDAHLLYLYGKKEDDSNFIEFINIATKQKLSEMSFENAAEISNIKFKNGYMEGMLYAKTSREEHIGQIIFNTPEFNSQTILLKVDLPSKDASIDWVDANPELEYLVYTIKEKGKVSAYVHQLATNETTQIKKFSGDKFLFDGEELVGFKSDKDKLEIKVYEYK